MRQRAPRLRARCSRGCCARPSITLGVGLRAAGARRRRCSPASARSSSRSSTRATCSSRRGACPASRSRETDRHRPAHRARAARASPRSRTSSPAPARPRSPPTRWASSRATSTSRLKPHERLAAGPHQGRRSPRDRRAARASRSPRSPVADLAADPDAHQRADRRRSLRRRRADLRPGPRAAAATGERDRRARLKGVPGVVDVRAEQTAGPHLPAHPPGPRAARPLRPHRRGRQPASPRRWPSGRTAGEVFEDDRRFALVVRTALDFQGNLDAIRALPLKSTLGQIVPLGDVADVALEQGPALVNRDKQSRRLIVEFNVRGRDLVSAVEEARAAVAAQVPLPAGYRDRMGRPVPQLRERPGPPRGRRAAGARPDRVPALARVRRGASRRCWSS